MLMLLLEMHVNSKFNYYHFTVMASFAITNINFKFFLKKNQISMIEIEMLINLRIFEIH